MPEPGQPWADVVAALLNREGWDKADVTSWSQPAWWISNTQLDGGDCLPAGCHPLARQFVRLWRPRRSDNGAGNFEPSEGLNPLREVPFVNAPYDVDSNGCVDPLEGPGLGLEVNEEFLRAHPMIEGPGFVSCAC